MVPILVAVFVVSTFMPLYTYAIYPLVLKVFPKIHYKKDEIKPEVTIIVFGDNAQEKLLNINDLNYPKQAIEIIQSNKNQINQAIRQSKGEIIFFTDTDTKLEADSLRKLIQNFSDFRIGVACGQLRKFEGSQGIYWKYENWVKKQESKIGRLSGANKAIFAVRKTAISEIPNSISNIEFNLATAALQSGWDSVFDEDAIAYEPNEDTDSGAFNRHANEGADNYKALCLFWRLLFPRKGSFTYVSHRVLKWLVPFNMVIAFISNGILAFHLPLFTVFFLLQCITYMTTWLYNKAKKYGKQTKGKIGAIIALIDYFIMLNLSYLAGLKRLICKQVGDTNGY